MDIQEKLAKPEEKVSSGSDSSERLAQETRASQKGNAAHTRFDRRDSSSQYLPQLELSGLDGNTKSLAQQHSEYLQRLESIENSRQIAENHEARLKRGIENSQKELDSSNFVDRLLGSKERQEAELKHRKEELDGLEGVKKSAQHKMTGLNPEIAKTEALVKREREERARGEVEKADTTAREAQQQMQSVMQKTEGVSYITKDNLVQSGQNRQNELDALDNHRDNLKVTKVVVDTVRDGAIAGAAVIATGGTLAPLMLEYGVGIATVSAIGAGTSAGTGVGVASRFGEAVSDIQANNKDPEKVFLDAAQGSLQDAKTALITSTSTVVGLGAASRFSAGLATETSVMKSMSGGAIAGGTEATVSTGLGSTDRYASAKADFEEKNGNLSAEERQKRWEEFKKENQLTNLDMARQSFTDITTGIVAGAVGGRIEVGKQAGSLSAKGLWTTADLTSEAIVTAGSAQLSATLQGREMSGQDLVSAATGVVTGRLVGGMAGKMNTESTEHRENTQPGSASETPTDLYHHDGDLPPRQKSDDSTLVDHIPLPHDRSKLQDMRKALVTDHVSGLLNQEGTHAAIDAGLKRALKENSPYTVIGIDLNGLKDFNDTYGHQTGDLALKAAGDYLNSRLHRSSDVKGRLHGDEYLVGAASSEEQLAFLKKEMKEVKLAVEVKRDADGAVLRDEKGKVVTAGVRVVKPGDTIRPDETIVLNSGISAGFQELTPELRQLSGPKLREELEKRADSNMYDTKIEKRSENERIRQEAEAAGKDLNGELKKKIESVPPSEFKLSDTSRQLSDRLREGAGNLRDSIPVELARPLYARRLEDSATKVPETGLLRKWAADQRSERLIKAAASENPPMPVTVVSMDLDGLKNLNDNYGHDAGSQMINAFGKWLNQRGRASDVVSHPYGADEFEITALNATPEQMQAFQKQLDGLRFVGHFDGDGKERSVSGIRVLRPGEELAQGESVIPYAGVSVGMASVNADLMKNPKEAYARAQEEADHSVMKDKERRLEEGKRIPRKQD